MSDLRNWQACPPPPRENLDGRFVRLEPFSAERHGADLFEVCNLSEADERFAWLPEYRPKSMKQFSPWLENAETSRDPLYFAVIDKSSGKLGGRQTFLRINEDMGSIEIGHIYWSGLVARKPAATEAFFLFAKLAFDQLGYRRFEWKCNNANEPSKRAAERFGMQFEGVFRQAAVVKGKNRDTAWYSIIDGEWPSIKSAFENWLEPANFDDRGQQIKKLGEWM